MMRYVALFAASLVLTSVLTWFVLHLTARFLWTVLVLIVTSILTGITSSSILRR